MLAEAVEVDVLHEDHLVVVFLEHRLVQDLARILVIAAQQELERCGDAGRRAAQPLARRILAELLQQALDQTLDSAHAPGSSPAYSTALFSVSTSLTRSRATGSSRP